MQGFADVVKPLYKLTEQSNRPFQWTSESDEAFQRLKEAMTHAPVLAYPTSEDPFVLDTDASNQGIGAVLSQLQDGKERVVAYYSRVLHKAERRYCVTRKELLGVVEGVRNFHHYLYGRKFLVRTDHGALQWLLNFKNPEGQLARWLEQLGTYDFDIQHRPGRQHGNADALSRRPCGVCKYCENAEHKGNSAKDEVQSCECSGAAGLAVRPIKHGMGETSKGTENLLEGSPSSGATLCAVQTRRSTTFAKPATDGSKSSPGVEPTVSMSWNNKQLREEQLADEELRPLIERKEAGGKRPDWSDVSHEKAKVKCY